MYSRVYIIFSPERLSITIAFRTHPYLECSNSTVLYVHIIYICTVVLTVTIFGNGKPFLQWNFVTLQKYVDGIMLIRNDFSVNILYMNIQYRCQGWYFLRSYNMLLMRVNSEGLLIVESFVSTVSSARKDYAMQINVN